ncbi:MAG: S8 family serine peptidase [bacterium]
MRRELRFCQRLQQLFLRLFIIAGSFLLLSSEGFTQKKARPLPPHVPGYVIVKIKSANGTGGQSASTSQSLKQKFRALEARAIFPGDHRRTLAKRVQDDRSLPDLSTYYKLIFPPSADVASLCAGIQAGGAVEYAVPDFIRYQVRDYNPAALVRALADNNSELGNIRVYTPNDPRFAEQDWLQQVQVPQAWDLVRADSTVIVGLVDTGFDFDHPDLAQRIWVNPAEDLNHNGRFDDAPASAGGDEDGVDNDNNGFVDDVVGWDFVGRFLDVIFRPDNFPQAGTGVGGSHGVETAGCVSAIGDNNFGIAGAGFHCTMIFTKHGSDIPSGGNLLNTAVFFYAEGVLYQALAGADIINMSFSGEGFSPFEAEMVDAVLRMGVLLVAAAGNGDADGVGDDNELSPRYPASFPGVLAVGAVQSDNRKAGFSNYGKPKFVPLFAPGENVLTITDPNNPHNNGQQFISETGTSFSSPIVAGIAALLKQQNPGRTAGEIFLQLCGAAENIDAANAGLQGRMGYGLVNAQRAVSGPAVPLPPDVDFVGVTLNDAASGDGNGVWEAGETAGFEVRLRNVLGNATNVHVQLSTEHWAVTVMNGTITLNRLPGLPDYENSFVTIPASQLIVSLSPEALPGRVPFRLRVSTGGYSEEFEFAWAILPSVLLVDDDDGENNVENYYLEAFELLGIGADYWTHNRHGTPPADLMKQYSTVAWACEWAFPALDSSDRRELSKYLDAGGNLFLSGQDIGWDLCDPEFTNEFDLSGGASLQFYETYLHARYLADDSPFTNLTGQDSDPIGAGLSLNVFQPGRTDTEQFPSEIEAIAPGESIFNYPNNRSGAVRYSGTHRAVYFAFGGYEAIAEGNTRREVMLRVINWLNSVNLEHTPLHDTEDTTAARAVIAKVTSTVSPVAQVALYWDIDGAQPFNRTEMVNDGDGHYSASIPAQNRKTVEYFIFARTINNFSTPIRKHAYASQPDRTPPLLAHLADVPNAIRKLDDYPVSVEATDNLGIDTSSVSLLFHSSSGGRDSTQLTPSTQAGRFEGGIPGSFVYGDTVFYQAKARDLALAGNRGETETKNFIVGLEDFENGLNEWSVQPNGWGLSTTAKSSGRYSANQSPQLTNYEQNLNATLTLAFPLDFSKAEDARLSFAELHLFQANQEDFGVVEISGDGGQNWSRLSEEFRGVGRGWQKKTYALTAYTGATFQDVRIRFRVQTDNQPQIGGRGWFVDDIQISVGATVEVKEREAPVPVPVIFALHQNYPNPFMRRADGWSENVTTSIAVELPVPAEIEITIYDLLGRRVATLADGRKLAGTHALRWDGRDDLGRAVANGIYFYRLKAISFDGKQQFLQIRKMMVLE